MVAAPVLRSRFKNVILSGGDQHVEKLRNNRFSSMVLGSPAFISSAIAIDPVATNHTVLSREIIVKLHHPI
jgi:hypothetical protein